MLPSLAAPMTSPAFGGAAGSTRTWKCPDLPDVSPSALTISIPDTVTGSDTTSPSTESGTEPTASEMAPAVAVLGVGDAASLLLLQANIVSNMQAASAVRSFIRPQPFVEWSSLL